MEGVKLNGKTVVITGSNTGIGFITARELAKRGARVILACRNREKGEAACREIITGTGNNNVELKILDLSSFSSVRKFAEDFNSSEERLDILVNNAGLFSRQRHVTEDGNEKTFGVNHLGHFLLTFLLLDKLKSSTPSRIVIVSSMAHEYKGEINFNDLQNERYHNMESYARSTGVTTYALHPGMVQTEFTREYQCCCLPCLMRCIACLSCQRYITAEEGAETSLYCCLEPSIADHSGRYYSNCSEIPAKSHATDPKIAQQLWDISMKICGLNDGNNG